MYLWWLLGQTGSARLQMNPSRSKRTAGKGFGPSKALDPDLCPKGGGHQWLLNKSVAEEGEPFSAHQFICQKCNGYQLNMWGWTE
eukprot:g64767.t1